MVRRLNPILSLWCGLWLLALLWPMSGGAAELVLSPETRNVDTSGYLSVLRDPQGQLGIDQVAAPEMVDRFIPLSRELTGGFSRDVVWLRLTLRRLPQTRPDWLIEIGQPFLDYIDLFVPRPGGGFIHREGGDRRPLSTRDVPWRNFVFRIGPVDTVSEAIYLRIQSTSTLWVQMTLWDLDTFHDSLPQMSMTWGLVYGGLFTAVLFAVVIALAGRQRIYIRFSLYGICQIGGGIALSGMLPLWLFPNDPTLCDLGTSVIICLSVATGAWFSVELLGGRKNHPLIIWLWKGIGFGALLFLIPTLLNRWDLVGMWINLMAVILLGMSGGVAIYRSFQGDILAQSFLLGCSTQFVGNLFRVVMILGCPLPAPLPQIMEFCFMAGGGMQILVVSGGLALQMIRTERARRRAQERLLEASRRAERDLEERVEARTREVNAVLNLAPYPLTISELQAARLIYANEPACLLLGLDSETSPGMDTLPLWPSSEIRNTVVAEVLAHGELAGFEIAVERNGHKLWLSLSAVRMMFRGKECLLTSLFDLSQRKAAEDGMRLAREQAEAALQVERRARREQQNFLAMVSHEFRSPLAVIESSSQLLSIYSAPDDEDSDSELAKIRRAVRRMSLLIETCLADDWMESALTTVKPCRTDLAKTVSSVMADSTAADDGRLSPLRISGDVHADVDESVVRLALTNLLDNAVKYSPAGALIEVSLEGGVFDVSISVADHGMGIEAAEQGLIFEKFYRSPRSDRVRGAGLGLHIVRRVAELHGGQVKVASLPGRGATFSLILPRDHVVPGHDLAIM